MSINVQRYENVIIWFVDPLMYMWSMDKSVNSIIVNDSWAHAASLYSMCYFQKTFMFPAFTDLLTRAGVQSTYACKIHEPSCTTRLRIGPWHGGSETSGRGGGLRAAASRSAVAGAKACRSEGMRRRQLHCAGRAQVRERQ